MGWFVSQDLRFDSFKYYDIRHFIPTVQTLSNTKLLHSLLRAVVCKIRAILKSRCHTISPNWLKIGM